MHLTSQDRRPILIQTHQKHIHVSVFTHTHTDTHTKYIHRDTQMTASWDRGLLRANGGCVHVTVQPVLMPIHAEKLHVSMRAEQKCH